MAGFNDERVIRELVTSAIQNCSKSRDQIADEMSLLLGMRVTKRALDSYTAESAEQNRFPLQYARAFCKVTGDLSLIRQILERTGLHAITSEDLKLLELGRQYLLEKRAAKTLADLERDLKDVQL